MTNNSTDRFPIGTKVRYSDEIIAMMLSEGVNLIGPVGVVTVTDQYSDAVTVEWQASGETYSCLEVTDILIVA